MRVIPSMCVLLAIVAACGGGTEPNNNGGGGGGGGGGGQTCTSTLANVAVRDNNYSPSCTTVPLGTTVTWDWTGSAAHNVTFDNASLGASNTQSDGTFQRQFSTAGTFNYHCTVHGSSMSGTVKVQ